MPNPAAVRAFQAVDGSPDAHRVLIEPPVSTTTVTPDVPEQAAALAGVLQLLTLPVSSNLLARAAYLVSLNRD